jgi:hypothetical protein
MGFGVPMATPLIEKNGLTVANPFGRATMKQAAASRVEVKKGETFRMKFTVIFHQARE